MKKLTKLIVLPVSLTLGLAGIMAVLGLTGGYAVIKQALKECKYSKMETSCSA